MKIKTLRSEKMDRVLSESKLILIALFASILLFLIIDSVVNKTFGPYNIEIIKANFGLFFTLFSACLAVCQIFDKSKIIGDYKMVSDDLEDVNRMLVKTNELHNLCLLGCSEKIYSHLEKDHAREIKDFIKNRIDVSAQKIDTSVKKLNNTTKLLEEKNSNFLKSTRETFDAFFNRINFSQSERNFVVVIAIVGILLGEILWKNLQNHKITQNNIFYQTSQLLAIKCPDIRYMCPKCPETSVDVIVNYFEKIDFVSLVSFLLRAIVGGFIFTSVSTMLVVVKKMFFRNNNI